MKSNSINLQNPNVINTAIITGSTGAGMIGGYVKFKFKAKDFNKFVESQIDDLRQENTKILEGINHDCFESIKTNLEYKTKIDNFEKEGKVFGKDFYLEDILNKLDLEDYQNNLKDFKETIIEGEKDAIKTAKEILSGKKLKYLSVGAIIGLGISTLGILGKTKLTNRKQKQQTTGNTRNEN